MHYQYDGAPYNFTQIIIQQFPNQGIICSSAQNWPLWWKDLNLLDTHVWVMFMLWCIHARCTWEKNYFG